MEDHSKEDSYVRAKKRVEEIKGFYWNIGSYIVIMGFLATMNYWIDRWEHPWFLWAAFGWGIGVVIHAAITFQWNPLLNKDWEEKKIKEFMKEDEDDYNRTSQRWE
ncbi:histidine kinase [Leptobacterium flavescens]|uniref:Histidine kinase n=1 Tax=Leptobacterium flavescens TaxID=472055 RepID=A0A6P0ULK8_9FLAO|nr:2TM domain-containing protein [Leptobacterium flavescens]NER14135.1 histidine kinase [Leptobacterium flavescens]